MKLKVQNIRGTTLLSFAMATLIAASGFVHLGRTSVDARRQASLLHETVIAEAHATELVEFFRSFTTKELMSYLSRNPFSGHAPYTLCAHINILDRQTGQIFNEDPLAELPLNGPLSQLDKRYSANRNYRIQVVNLKTMKIRKEVCGEAASNLSYSLPAPGKLALLPEEKFLVTVGVSWIPSGRTVSNVKRVALSAVLANR